MKIKRKLKYSLLRLFRLKGSPHQIAAGMTIGFLPNWFPTFGLGPVLSVALARLIKANLFAAVFGGLIGTLIWPFLFLLNYKVGSLLLSQRPKIDEIKEVDYIEALNHTVDGFENFRNGGYMFLMGAAVNILVSSIVIYIAVYWIFKRYRVGLLNKVRFNDKRM
ncbi:DUF2062 domain-containing protein [Chungangia koreensis]|uniref:DUF2062 domain-containing protein n=2 Tax=Chungangia koreensis TaxID=752657 RepID=A0ABV8X3N6_9LACT